jgi:hypothetical protein
LGRAEKRRAMKIVLELGGVKRKNFFPLNFIFYIFSLSKEGKNVVNFFLFIIYSKNVNKNGICNENVHNIKDAALKWSKTVKKEEDSTFLGRLKIDSLELETTKRRK